MSEDDKIHLNELLYDNRIMSTFIDNSEVGIYVVDFYTCEILFTNRKMAKYAGAATAMELIGKSCWSYVCPSGGGRCAFCPYDKLIDENGNPKGQYVWERYFEQKDNWLKIISEAIAWVDGRLAHMVTFYDITEMKKMQDQLTGLAFNDRLLGLSNELKLEHDLTEMESKPSLIIFDILSLQKVNEAYGRDIGDLLLLSIRDWIQGMNIPYSKLYRIGGDEFCFVVERIAPDPLKALANTISLRFSKPWMLELADSKMNIFCGATIAIIHAGFINKEENLLNLLERTFKAAKYMGKVVFYDEKMDEDFKKRLQFELSIKRCVRESMDGFDVHYQPITDPITGTWYGLEVLCRWNSPELGVVTPSLFIPEAERLELIGTIGLWAMETSVRKCKDWGLDKHRKFILDVNLSAIQFTDEMLAEKILNILSAYDFPCEKLCLEITESTQFTFTDLSLQTIQYLRGKNILVALDDFGTGYSNFNNLKSLPIDIVKIERVFVTNIENDSYQQYLFHAMAELAHAADMKLIAEGVESREQVDILLKNGADYLQGYLFSKPLSSEALEAQLHHFYDIDPSFSVIRERKIDIKELLDEGSSYILTPNLYKVLNRGMRILLYHADIDNAIKQVLKIVGMHMDVSRTYVFLRETGNVFSNTHEWCAEGIESQKDTLMNTLVPDSWVNSLKNEGIILSSDINNLPEDVHEVLIRQNIRSIVVIPLWEGNELLGFVGCDDCGYLRDWRPEEIILLHNLCVIITNMLSKRLLKDEIDLRNVIQTDILNNIDFPVYVSDIETGEILFANKHLNDIIGQKLEGCTCWEVLQGRNEKCDFCKIDELIKNPDKTECVWEYYNPILKKRYKVHDSLIPWLNNKKAHLEYASDFNLLPKTE